jgi:hypothetical protein
MTDVTMHVGVSFAKTPVNEIGSKAEALRALGWREGERGDPWAISYFKSLRESQTDRAEDEVRGVMGEHWLSADEIRGLLSRRRPSV